MPNQDDAARVKSAAEIIRTSLIDFWFAFDDLHQVTARVSARASAVWDGNAWVINEDTPHQTDYPGQIAVASDEASVDSKSDGDMTPWQLLLDQRKTGWPLLLDQFWEEIQRFWSSWDDLQSALQPLPDDVEGRLIEQRLDVLTKKWILDLKRKIRPIVGWVEETLGQRTWVTNYSKAAAEGRTESFERLLKKLASSPPAPCDFTDAIDDETANLHDFANLRLLEADTGGDSREGVNDTSEADEAGDSEPGDDPDESGSPSEAHQTGADKQSNTSEAGGDRKEAIKELVETALIRKPFLLARFRLLAASEGSTKFRTIRAAADCWKTENRDVARGLKSLRDELNLIGGAPSLFVSEKNEIAVLEWPE